MNLNEQAVTYKGTGRRFMTVRFMPPWMDIDGNCIAAPDPTYKHKYALRGFRCANEDCAEWLKAIAGSKIVWLGEDKFEYEECPHPRTIAEWREWEAGKEQWELLSHGSEITLYSHDVFAANMKSRMQAFDERINAHLSGLAHVANQEIEALCAKALQRIEQFS